MKKRLCTALLSVLLPLSACAAPAAEEHSQLLLAMDTVMTVTAYGPEGEEAVQAACGRIRELESLLSVTDPDSEVYAVNHSGGAPVEVSADTAALTARALELCADTAGALDVTVYPVVRAWGFTTGDYRVPGEEELTALLERVDYRQVKLEAERLSVPEGVELDLGAVAKGYTGDQVCALLEQAGVTSAKLELGGNVQLLGSKPDGSLWRVAVRDPEGEGYVGIVEAADRAVITSGGYERFFEEGGETYWHIIDPASGRPARSGLVSVTVMARSGVTADALSTALFVMGREKAEEYWHARRDFECILIGADGTVTITPGLRDSFTLAGEGRTLEIWDET